MTAIQELHSHAIWFQKVWMQLQDLNKLVQFNPLNLAHSVSFQFSKLDELKKVSKLPWPREILDLPRSTNFSSIFLPFFQHLSSKRKHVFNTRTFGFNYL